MKLLLTGGAGFIGSNFVRYALEHHDDLHIVNVDCLSYSGNLENLTEFEKHPRYEFVHGNVCDGAQMRTVCERCDAVVHMAAESHVDRAILDPRPFVESNTLGTQTLLEAWRQTHGTNGRFVYVSTDEVYGSLSLDDKNAFTETTNLDPSGAYSASKAAGDLFVGAYANTFGLDACITRCSNNFGPYQFPEKVIPLFVTNLIEGQQVPLYGDGKNIRDWIHVDDHCEAVLAVLFKGKKGEAYNVGSNNERSNLDLTHSILELMGKGKDMIRPVEDRLGHDRRYAIDSTKIKNELGWEATRSAWPAALESTVRWYVDNPKWWKRVKSGAYREYYAQQYGAHA